MRTVCHLGGTCPQAWCATGIPADPTQEFVIITWDNPNAEEEFEARPEVLSLGAPWEPLPDAAVPLIESMQDPEKLATQSLSKTILSADTQPETVHSALSKLPGAWGRMIR